MNIRSVHPSLLDGKRKRGINMQTKKMDVTFGTKEKGNLWELKNVEYSIPSTMQEWIETLTEEKCVLAIETLDLIRRQDAVRRAHVGGKNTRGLTDEKCREVAREFKLFEKTRVAFERRPPTPEEAIAALLALSPEKLAAAMDEIKKAAKNA